LTHVIKIGYGRFKMLFRRRDIAPDTGAPATSTQSPLMGSSLPDGTSPAVDGFASGGSARGGVGAVPPSARVVDSNGSGGSEEWRMILALTGNHRDRDGLGWGRRGVTGIQRQGELG